MQGSWIASCLIHGYVLCDVDEHEIDDDHDVIVPVKVPGSVMSASM